MKLRWMFLGGVALSNAAVACGSGGGSGGKNGEAGDNGNATTGSSSTTGSNASSGGATSGDGVAASSGGGSSQAGAAGEAGASGGPIDFESCATSEEKGVLTPANLLFVIDRSGSMNCNAPETGQTSASCETTPEKQFVDEPSKWEIVSEALSEALDELTDQPNVTAGVVMFPRPDSDNECAVATEPDVELAPLSGDHKGAIDDFLTSVEPGGRTPIAGATITSYGFLADALRAEDLNGNTFVVLLTDGQDTCDGDQRPELLEEFVEEHVPNATEFNIRTFVIGAPGSEVERRLLSQIAFAGETSSSPSCDHDSDSPDVGDCHFDMTTTDDFASELGATLTRIAEDKTLSCVFDVPDGQGGRGIDLGKINVTYTPGDGEAMTVSKDTTPCDDGAEGWQYSGDNTQILLCGEICELVRSDPEAEVNIVLGCLTEIVK
jgi:Mg-chelatase subunit ChlD